MTSVFTPAAGSTTGAPRTTLLEDDAHDQRTLQQIHPRDRRNPTPRGRYHLFFGRVRASGLVTPWATCTDPEVAGVGLTEEVASRARVAVDTMDVALEDVHRARLDEAPEGFCRIVLAKGTDRILGATILSAPAGEHMGAIALAMTNGLGLAAFGRTMHPYPTQGEVLRKAADRWRRRKLTPTVRALLARYFRVIG